jgi:hypothetical protein
MADAAPALTYLEPNDKAGWFKRTMNDSIPFRTGERVVIERKGVVSPWVVAVVHLNYEEVRKHIEQSLGHVFGIAETRETVTTPEDFHKIDPNVPEDPLFGVGFGGFHELVPDMKATRECDIVSKPFNRVPKVRGHSISKWRVVDGKEMLNQAWTIIVVERRDFSREWARDHTGMPWPFKIAGETRVVTETEIHQIENLAAQYDGLIVDYFVPYPAYKTGEVLQLMKAIIADSKVAKFVH